MLMLAIDTSTATGGAALTRDGHLVGEVMLSVRAVHSERLMPAVEWLLGAAGVSVRELDAICCGVGPGSFTGVRIGVSAAKAMAYALDVPLVGVSTLDALAAGRAHGSDVEVWSLIDARHGRCYSARYLVRAGGDRPELVSDYAIRTIADLSIENRWGRCLFVGDGAVSYRDDILRSHGDSAWVAPQALALLRPVQVAMVGAAMLAEGIVHSPATLVPHYLKASAPEDKAAGGNAEGQGAEGKA